MIAEFEGFIKVLSSLPKMSAIIKHPKECPIPENTNPSAQYAIVEAMLDNVSSKVIKPFLTYISRFNSEFQMWFIGQLKETNPECLQTEAYTTWAADKGIE
jgi:hypothetical protein